MAGQRPAALPLSKPARSGCSSHAHIDACTVGLCAGLRVIHCLYPACTCPCSSNQASVGARQAPRPPSPIVSLYVTNGSQSTCVFIVHVHVHRFAASRPTASSTLCRPPLREFYSFSASRNTFEAPELNRGREIRAIFGFRS